MLRERAPVLQCILPRSSFPHIPLLFGQAGCLTLSADPGGNPYALPFPFFSTPLPFLHRLSHLKHRDEKIGLA
jgi:hypothetical protein